MRLSLLSLLPTLALTLAHPSPPSTSHLTTSTTGPSLILTVFDFYAYLTASPTNSNNYNWATFTTYTNDYSAYAVCSAATLSTLPSNDVWYPCEMLLGGKQDVMWFQVTEGFGELGIKRGWDANGTYLTGWATEDTFWDESDGGNVTAGDEGKYYKRSEPWTFEITKVIA